MEFYAAIFVKLLVGSVLLGTGCTARPLETEDYRPYQNSGGNSYTPALLSPGTFGSSQSGFSSLGNNAPGMFLPQSIPQSSLNSFGNPFGGQTYGASNYGGPGGYPAGIPNYFG